MLSKMRIYIRNTFLLKQHFLNRIPVLYLTSVINFTFKITHRIIFDKRKLIAKTVFLEQVALEADKIIALRKVSKIIRRGIDIN